MSGRLGRLAIFLLMASALHAQTYQTRTYYQQNLEPINGILHGAGQDGGQAAVAGKHAFDRYWDTMESGKKPVSYMYYEALSGIGKTWASKLRNELAEYGDTLIVIQFGLELVGVTEAVANGDHDDDIADWLNGIEELGLPVYARLGYEFNGLSWNGYQPEPYKAAFIYLADKIRERNLEIATVWNFVPDQTQPLNFMAYYPGNEYVDWWSFNVFESYQIGHWSTDAYLDSAEVHQKPVLIGESTPKFVGVLNSQFSWDNWFAPFFELLMNEPAIKMTGYINWDWAEFPAWSNWGDARIQQNTVISQNMNDEMSHSIYTHAGDEKAFRLALGYTENLAPSTPQNLFLDTTSYPPSISWEASFDSSGILRYLISDGDSVLGFTGLTSYTILAEADEELSISVVAVDRAGNRSANSTSVSLVYPPSPAEKIFNGNFDNGTAFWDLNHYVANVSGTFEIDTSGLLDGRNSAHITLLQNSGTNWHIQFQQPLVLEAGHRYAISYLARSEPATIVETWVQQDHAPWFGYATQNISLTTEVQQFRDTTSVADVDDTVFLAFMMGTSGLAEIWFDSVSVVDLGPQVGVEINPEQQPPGGFVVSPAYPNPFNPATTLPYYLPGASEVAILIFNVLGQRTAHIEAGPKSAGWQTFEWQAQGQSSGLYFITIKSRHGVKTAKALLLK